MLCTVEIEVTLKVALSQLYFLMLIEEFCFIELLKSPWMSEEELRGWLTESQCSPAGVFGRGGGPSEGEGEHLFPPRNRFSSGQYVGGGRGIVGNDWGWRILESAVSQTHILGFMRMWWFHAARFIMLNEIYFPQNSTLHFHSTEQHQSSQKYCMISEALTKIFSNWITDHSAP